MQSLAEALVQSSPFRGCKGRLEGHTIKELSEVNLDDRCTLHNVWTMDQLMC